MGQTYLITGANTGIGFATARELAGRDGRVFIASRSAAKGEAAVAAIKAATGNDAVFWLALDLADLDSVRACAKEFLDRGEPLHVLINNAGVAGQQGLTRQGFELTFGVNHLGHFALTSALTPLLTASAPARIVNVASDSLYRARGIDWDALRRRGRGLTGMPQYSVAKLCNLLHVQELARRLDGSGVTVYALHPGVVASDIWRRIPWPVRPLMTRRMLTTEQGAVTSLHCATSPSVAAETGRYYDECQVRDHSAVATPELAERLWKYSTEWTGLG
jgi:retinol dehydrogenase 12